MLIYNTCSNETAQHLQILYGYTIYLAILIYQSIRIIYIEDEITFGIFIPSLPERDETQSTSLPWAIILLTYGITQVKILYQSIKIIYIGDEIRFGIIIPRFTCVS